MPLSVSQCPNITKSNLDIVTLEHYETRYLISFGHSETEFRRSGTGSIMGTGKMRFWQLTHEPFETTPPPPPSDVTAIVPLCR